MKLREALHHSREVLSLTKIEDTPLEAEILLRHVLGINRIQLYLNPDIELTSEQSQAYDSLIQRRLAGEPTAYITGHREFYGLDFYVDRRVLIPRPESELLVDKTLEFVRGSQTTQPIIADVGTGCGNLAIAIASHLPWARIFAIDISPAALEVAAINFRNHKVNDRVHLLQGNLIEPLLEKVDILLANLPYVKKADMSVLDSNVRDFEPYLALEGGIDGLDYISRLLAQALCKINRKGAILLELGQGQGEPALALAKRQFPQSKVCLYPDLGGIDRVLGIYLSQPSDIWHTDLETSSA